MQIVAVAPELAHRAKDGNAPVYIALGAEALLFAPAALDVALQPDPNAPVPVVPSGVPTAEAEPSRIDPTDAARAAELSAD